MLGALVGKFIGLRVFVTHEGEGAAVAEDHFAGFWLLLDYIPNVPLDRFGQSSCFRGWSDLFWSTGKNPFPLNRFFQGPGSSMFLFGGSL